MEIMIRKVWYWSLALTEDFRSWLSWKIFPEQEIYMDAVRRIGEIEENERILKIFAEADSGCSEWAIEQVRGRAVLIERMMKELEETYGEVPF
jgi:hypothetical protein